MLLLRGCFLCFGFSTPLKRSLNTTDIEANNVFCAETLSCLPPPESMTSLHRAQTANPSNTFGVNWKAHWESGLIAQHRWLTLLMLL